MTLEHAREIITQQLQFGGGYNRNAVRLLLGLPQVKADCIGRGFNAML